MAIHKKLFKIYLFIQFSMATFGRDFDRQYYVDHALLPVSKLIALEGYPEETFQVRTSDGVILELHRIPYGKNATASDPTKKPVLMLHGIMMSAYYWIIHPKLSLAYMLADRGYDVFMGNFRGQSQFETRKTFTKTLGPKGWRFTQDDLALFDVPTFIDYIIKATGKKQVHIIGFSLGNTVSFEMLAGKPEYNKKVASLIALGPSVYIEKDTGPARFFNTVPFGKFMLEAAAAVSGFGAVKGTGITFKVFMQSVCKRKVIKKGAQRRFCQFLNEWHLGVDPDISQELLLDFFNRVTPVPSKVLMQFQQSTSSGRFAHFDHGPTENQRLYNSTLPPIYDLRKIKTKVVVIDGPTDAFNTKKNAKFIGKQMDKSNYTYYRVKDAYFSHNSFVLAKDVDRKVYPIIFEFLDQLNKNKSIKVID